MISHASLRLAPLALAPILVLALAACSGKVAASPAPADDAGPDAAPLADAGALDAAAPVTRTLITEPDRGMSPLYAFLQTATRSIDMTMYELTDTMVTDLLTKAASQGVVVRVILDQNLEMQSNTAAFDALNAGGAQAHWANPTFQASHAKSVTVDGTTTAIMTLNFTPEYYSTSREFAVVTNDPVDVAAIEATFAADFASSSVTPSNGTDLVWSPTNSQSAMLGLIAGAKRSLLIENEEMDDANVVGALKTAAGNGVDVRVVMTDSSSWTASFQSLTMGGVKVSTYAKRASLYIHAKVILADEGAPGASVFIGSENFSNASLTENRELGLITTDPAILSSVSATLTSDFAGATVFP